MAKRGRKKGYVVTQATKDKIAKTHTGMKHSQETKDKLSKYHTGLKQSEESKRKNSESNIATWARKKKEGLV